MQISQEHKSQIEEIVRSMQCPRDFKCYKSDFRDLPKSRLIADGKLVECLEANRRCSFGLAFGHGTICTCKLRNYIAENFHV